MADSKVCPGCLHKCDPIMIMCRDCWGKVPGAHKVMLYRTGRAWLADLGNEELAKSYKDAVEAVIGVVEQ